MLKVERARSSFERRERHTVADGGRYRVRVGAQRLLLVVLADLGVRRLRVHLATFTRVELKRNPSLAEIHRLVQTPWSRGRRLQNCIDT